jgi:hypothetical protein
MRYALLLCSCLALGILGCSDDPKNCLEAGECECMVKEHCPEGEECIGGSCGRLTPPEAPKREFGEPCDRDRECRTGYCLPRGPGNGGVCTRTCEAEACPEDWDCKTHIPVDGSGEIRLCVQQVENKLCRSCSVDAQCNAIGDKCLELSGEFFCARDCSLHECPPGYSCNPVEVTGAASAVWRPSA